eukprot:7430039-Pyramimonas_sp.AAC.1
MVASALSSLNTSIVVALRCPPGSKARKHFSAAAADLATIPPAYAVSSSSSHVSQSNAIPRHRVTLDYDTWALAPFRAARQ